MNCGDLNLEFSPLRDIHYCIQDNAGPFRATEGIYSSPCPTQSPSLT